MVYRKSSRRVYRRKSNQRRRTRQQRRRRRRVSRRMWGGDKKSDCDSGPKLEDKHKTESKLVAPNGTVIDGDIEGITMMLSEGEKDVDNVLFALNTHYLLDLSPEQLKKYGLPEDVTKIPVDGTCLEFILNDKEQREKLYKEVVVPLLFKSTCPPPTPTSEETYEGFGNEKFN